MVATHGHLSPYGRWCLISFWTLTSQNIFKEMMFFSTFQHWIVYLCWVNSQIQYMTNMNRQIVCLKHTPAILGGWTSHTFKKNNKTWYINLIHPSLGVIRSTVHTGFFAYQFQWHQGPQTWLHNRGEGWWGSCCCNQDGQHPGNHGGSLASNHWDFSRSPHQTPCPWIRNLPMLEQKQPMFELFFPIGRYDYWWNKSSKIAGIVYLWTLAGCCSSSVPQWRGELPIANTCLSWKSQLVRNYVPQLP